MSSRLTRRTLPAELRRRGIAARAYSIQRDGEETYCLHEEDGAWVVFYSERGTRTDVRRHASEEAACRDLVARLERDPTSRWTPPPVDG